MLDFADRRSPQSLSDANPHLVIAGVSRFVAEENEIVGTVRLFVAMNGAHDRFGGRDRVPLPTVGDQMDELGRAEGRCVAQLLGRLGRTNGKHGDRSPSLFDNADRLFNGTLLVWTDREAELAYVDVQRVGGEDDACSHHGHALHTDQNVHVQLLTREFSGSKSGVAPTTSTVTG